ncbi:MAG: TetR/AcrR family transcriptional regulator, partial [Deltaproteobacteria bacterium]
SVRHECPAVLWYRGRMGRRVAKGGRTVRRSRMVGRDRREQILVTASRLLATEGPAALRPDRVAAAAGVSRPVVYDHFACRDALAAALIERYGDMLLGRVESALSAHPDDLEAATRAALGTYLDCVHEEGAGLRILLGTTGHGVDDTRRRVHGRAVAVWAARIVKHGGIPPADARAAAVSLTASIWALVGLWLEGRISRSRLEEIHLPMAMGALDSLAGARRRKRPRAG